MRCSSHPIFHLASLLLSLVFILVLSRAKGVLSDLNFSTQVSSQYSLRSLCSLGTLTIPYSYSLQRAQHVVKLLSRTGRIENPSSSACGHPSIGHLVLFSTVQLRTLCVGCSLATLFLAMTSGAGLKKLPGFSSLGIFRHAPIPRKGSGNNKNVDICNTVSAAASNPGDIGWAARFLCNNNPTTVMSQWQLET